MTCTLWVYCDNAELFVIPSSDASREVMARFAKNYIPIFFNLYTAKPEADRDPKRMAVLETAKVYFQIADPKVCGEKKSLVCRGWRMQMEIGTLAW